MESTSFRNRHPILASLLLLAGIAVLGMVGLSLVVSGLFHSRPTLATVDTGIGVVELDGPILSSAAVVEDLVSFRDSPKIKGIVLRVDSPGGLVGASQEIHAEVQRCAAAKPLVVSLGSVAASGGYYAALGATEILASPGTITGSIGVIMKFPNLAELFEKIGLANQVVKSGAMKDIGAADRPLSDEERAVLQGVIDSVHRQFVLAVVEGRRLAEEEVWPLADGRIFSGEQALARGLIDRYGTFRDAVARVAELAGLDKVPELVYPERRDFSLLELVAGRQEARAWRRALVGGAAMAYEWRPGGI
ncbi:MAG: signal peptide peptidase SppA [Thermodesulfobacteriota bacterium]